MTTTSTWSDLGTRSHDHNGEGCLMGVVRRSETTGAWKRPVNIKGGMFSRSHGILQPILCHGSDAKIHWRYSESKHY